MPSFVSTPINSYFKLVLLILVPWNTHFAQASDMDSTRSLIISKEPLYGRDDTWWDYSMLLLPWIFWQSTEFEATYLQRLQKLLFSTAAIAYYPPFSAVWRSTNSASGFRHVPAGLLQLAFSGTAGMWHQSTTICSECSRTTVRWRIQIWFHGPCVAWWFPLTTSQAENHFQGRVFRYKAIHGLAPPYLKELFVPVSSVPAFSRNRSASLGTSSLHLQQGTLLTVNEVLQWWDLPGGTTFLWSSATLVPYKRFVPDSRHFYLVKLTTFLPHNLTVCFSLTLAVFGHLLFSILSVT